MKAPFLCAAFLTCLTLSMTACHSDVASPRMGLDVNALTKTLSISSKLTTPDQPLSTTAAADTSRLLVQLPSMVD